MINWKSGGTPRWEQPYNDENQYLEKAKQKFMKTGKTETLKELHAKKEIEEKVISKIRERKNFGMKKYGVSVADSKEETIDWLQHAQNEAMDCAIYLERLMRDMAERKKERG
jgi:hypothetical protein